MNASTFIFLKKGWTNSTTSIAYQKNRLYFFEVDDDTSRNFESYRKAEEAILKKNMADFFARTKNGTLYLYPHQTYSNMIPAAAHCSIISFGQTLTWVSPIWAFRRKYIQSRD